MNPKMQPNMLCKLRRRALSVLAACVLLATLTACSLTGSGEGENLEFTIVSEEKIPEELMTLIEERLTEPFQLTFHDGESLYIVIGYGEQSVGGYSIAVDRLDQTDTAICVDTTLIGPQDPSADAAPSYPYIVIRLDYIELPVNFE